ncbi:hypothetical protein M432DRAFT_377513 [Thermoascus aurantiacus ATCC 26904]
MLGVLALLHLLHSIGRHIRVVRVDSSSFMPFCELCPAGGRKFGVAEGGPDACWLSTHRHPQQHAKSPFLPSPPGTRPGVRPKQSIPERPAPPDRAPSLPSRPPPPSPQVQTSSSFYRPPPVLLLRFHLDLTVVALSCTRPRGARDCPREVQSLCIGDRLDSHPYSGQTAARGSSPRSLHDFTFLLRSLPPRLDCFV